MKNIDKSKCNYSGYGIGFDNHRTLSMPGGGFGKKVIILGVDLSFSGHVDYKKKDILILSEGPT